MIVQATDLVGVYTISTEVKHDKRGSLFRIFDAQLQDIFPEVIQASVVTNIHRLTLRGMHFQEAPHGERKVVLVTKGEIFDVIVNVNPLSTSYLRSFQYHLSSDGPIQGIVIPSNYAHGYLTLTPDSQITYLMDKAYSEAHAKGIRWDDPRLGIDWPESPQIISERDGTWEFKN